MTYWYVVRTQAADLANVLWTYEFDSPPASAQAGQTITMSHVLSVDGHVKVGGGHTPSGYAAYSSQSWTPRTLTVLSAAVNLENLSTSDSEMVQFKFPNVGDRFSIEAQVLDTQKPDIGCDVVWWYERTDTAGP